MSEHIVSTKLYCAIWNELRALTGITAGVAFIELSPDNTGLALTIATLKAVLVVLFFMHLQYTSEKMTSVVVVSALFWLLILLVTVLADYQTRPHGVN